MDGIRWMRKEDVECVWRIENACFSKPWSERSFLDAIESEHTLYLVAEWENAVAGYCGFYLTVDSADLCNIAVEETCRKRGMGERMLKQAFSLLSEMGVEKVFLEVRETNLAAIRLYEKTGFQKIGIRKGYYSEPQEDAILMEALFQ